ncbi:hypothetical protein RND81_07G033200 [Saponaria officinalis]|uniref:Uncharacterized protein n=1 Tax=Saponaria officinalis TaxID=3572 RepID=A0AAW1JMF2_SAPOF
MQRKMQASGMERLIKRHETHHIINTEKRVLARKALEHKVQSQDLARKLKSILNNKVSFYSSKASYGTFAAVVGGICVLFHFTKFGNSIGGAKSFWIVSVKC